MIQGPFGSRARTEKKLFPDSRTNCTMNLRPTGSPFHDRGTRWSLTKRLVGSWQKDQSVHNRKKIVPWLEDQLISNWGTNANVNIMILRVQLISISKANRLVHYWIYVILLNFVPYSLKKATARKHYESSCEKWQKITKDPYISMKISLPTTFCK